MFRTVAIALIPMLLQGCGTKPPPPSIAPALEQEPPSHLMEPCPDLPENVRVGGSRDEDIRAGQLLYDHCARKTAGWIAYWRQVQESVEAAR
jgi:hypothetical protein